MVEIQYGEAIEKTNLKPQKRGDKPPSLIPAADTFDVVTVKVQVSEAPAQPEVARLARRQAGHFAGQRQ